jgi:predicted NACHT family NTPase
MSDKDYNWCRYWHPRDEGINFDEDGFPYELGYLNSNLVTFDSLIGVPCLVLLGEPGTGKSTILEAEYQAASSRAAAEGNAALFRDLALYNTDIGLTRDLFEDPAFRSWADGTHLLELFLDSLDECRLRIESVNALLLSKIKHYGTKRLRLRIGCRSADWTKLLDKGLAKLWEEGEVRAYQLAPLGREQVRIAAAAEGFDLDEFPSEVVRKGVAPFAVKPLTLRMLLAIYRAERRLPQTQAEIYRQGCLLLCGESSESRAASGRTGDYTPEQRMVVAGRIAALCVLSNRAVVYKGHIQVEAEREDLTYADIRGGREVAGGESFEVTNMVIEETLGTSLFAAAPGTGRLRWAHQAYAEHLAAWYLTARCRTPEQIMRLLVHPDDPEGRLVPQLHETTARAASLMPTLIEPVMKSDPEVLLRSDLTLTSAETHAGIVAALLEFYADERAYERFRPGSLSHLAYSGIANQLWPYITEQQWNIDVRRLAISIAEDCHVNELQNVLCDVALDETEPQVIRVRAALAISRYADEQTRARLKPLALLGSPSDRNDEIKGYGLQAVWRNNLTVEELFASLTEPRESYTGSYKMFIWYRLAPGLRAEDFPTALRWVTRRGGRHGNHSSFDKLCDEIMLRAWEALDSQDVADAFAEAMVVMLKRHEDVVERPQRQQAGALFLGDDSKRRRVLERVIARIDNAEDDWALLIQSQVLSLTEHDMTWLIEQLEAAESPEVQRALAKAIKYFLWRGIPEHLSLVLSACPRNEILSDEVSELIAPVQRESPAADAMRARHEREQSLTTPRGERRTLKPTPAERVQARLERIETGVAAEWVWLNVELTLEPNSVYYEHEDRLDLTTLPGWLSADEETRSRIVGAAKKYVLEHEPNEREWLADALTLRLLYAGRRAWLLLTWQAPEFITGLAPEVWKRWAHVLVLNPPSDNTESVASSYPALIAAAHQHAAGEIAEKIAVKIETDNRVRGNTSIARNVKNYWSEQLAGQLFDMVQGESLTPSATGHLLGWLLARGAEEARTYAETLIPSPPPRTPTARKRALTAAHALMLHSEDASWPVIWRAIQADAKFGRRLLLNFAHSDEEHEKSVAERLSEEQAAGLYVWLVRQFPHAEDPEHEGVYSPTPRDSIQGWRDGLLRHLQQRGTREACAAVEHIMRELPELDWLKRVLIDARNVTRRNTWTPLRPGEVREVLTDDEKRAVQNGDQLLDVLTESLRRLEAKLQGETPAAIDLWNEVRAPGNAYTYRPKDEERFSDYVKRHLEDDLKGRGVIVNREVEIRRGTGAGDGERTDIHVHALIPPPGSEVYDAVRVIIETKGCWHRELFTAMETQLAGRYLRDNSCQHGLYLVGWFACDRWDDNDRRKTQTPRLSRVEAQRQLERQASELSQDGAHIRAFILNTALR